MEGGEQGVLIFVCCCKESASGRTVRKYMAGVPVLGKWARIIEDARAWHRELFAVQGKAMVGNQEDGEVCVGSHRRCLLPVAEELAGASK